MGYAVEYIARGEVLDDAGEVWLQEIQLGECDGEDQAAALVASLIERGDLDAWLWVDLYRLEHVRTLRDSEAKETEEAKETAEGKERKS